MRYLLLLILLGVPVLAVVGDFDSSGETDPNDLATFAADWLLAEPNDLTADLNADGVVNLLDFALFAPHWRDDGINAAPTTSAVEAACETGRSVAVTLTASDPEGDDLTYSLVTEPTKGLLVGEGADQTYYAWPTATGADVFTFKVNDGELDSNVSDVNVVVSLPTADTIAFESRSSVVVDSNSINIDDSFAIAFWFRTLWPDAALFTKRADGAGVTIDLEDGRAAVRLYDGNGNIYPLFLDSCINNGLWSFIYLSYSSSGNLEFNGDPNVTAVFGFKQLDTDAGFTDLEAVTTAIVPVIDFSNDADAVFGSARSRMFYGAIDNFANYDTALDTFETACVSIEGRSGTPFAFSPSYYRRYLINEGTGLTTADTTATYEATMTNHGKTVWRGAAAPINQRNHDRQRLRGIDGADMLKDNRRRF